MNFEKLSSMACRIFFFAANALLAIAAVEWVVRLFGLSVQRTYTPGRLTEFAGIFLVFVIVVLLRQIREELKRMIR